MLHVMSLTFPEKLYFLTDILSPTCYRLSKLSRLAMTLDQMSMKKSPTKRQKASGTYSASHKGWH